METPNLTKLLEEISHLQRGAELLERIWASLDPYTDKIEPALWREVRDYFKFDDSE